jgi:RNA polymerase-interacting CarD/CdnL/TRCF family regulator
MGFHIGDKVIHSTFGFGEIINIEEKTINGKLENCFVVQMSDMTIWVPIEDTNQTTLRTPTSPEEFIDTLPILTSPTENLDEDRVLRKKQLSDQLKDGQLSSICRVVRDLSSYQHTSKLNDQERSILDRAVKSLLTEWTFSLGTTQLQARQAMESMLES